ncbi:MAG: uridine diphosphate-N-acetylglucosamine-binding protein YvcK [Acidimicrobiia bacterium]|nr:uridine diphosphate-N-acetylglucosamine-binding protein YvcK [Acidimicrobiia bacterium]
MTIGDPATQALLQTLTIDGGGPRVVAIGGGHGMSNALRAALTYAGRVDAVVTVADDGGSSGRLIRQMDIPPPGDLRKCLLALTPDGSVWRNLFEYRFEESDVAGHSLGNLLLAALADIEGDMASALERAEDLLQASGSVIPACSDRLQLRAEAGDRILDGQVVIQRHRGRIDIVDVLPASAAATPRAVTVIERADQILLGPGSLITSTVAALRVPGITEAVNQSEGRLVYIANLITQDGETIDMDGADHLEALLRLTGVRPPGAIVAHEHAIEIAPPLRPVMFEPEILATYGADLTTADIADRTASWPAHDPDKLGRVLAALT